VDIDVVTRVGETQVSPKHEITIGRTGIVNDGVFYDEQIVRRISIAVRVYASVAYRTSKQLISNRGLQVS